MGRQAGDVRGTVIAAVVLLIALTGCGGGGGGVVGIGEGAQGGNPQTVGVSGMVTTGSASLARSLGSGPRPMASGETPLAAANVRAIDYATGQEYVFSPLVVTDGAGNYRAALPKGKDFILFFQKAVAGGGTERLSVVVPKASAGQVVSADFGTSLVAESVATTGGQFRSLSDAWVDNLTLSVADNVASLSLTDNTFTVSTPARPGALIVGTLPGAGLDTTYSPAVAAIQQTIANLITDMLVSPPGKPAPSITPGAGQVLLRWAAVDNATQYRVYRATSDNVSRSWWIDYVTVAQTSWADTSVADGTTYYYVVTASNSGAGADSALVSARPKAAGVGVPSGVTATPGDGMITVEWSPVSGATGYAVYWSASSTVSVSTGTKISCDNATTHADVGGLTNGTPYYFIVTAVKAGVESVPSAMVSAAPEYVPPPHAGIAEAKAMISNLRNTAQSLTGYRSGGTATGPGLIDNAAGVLGAKIDNAVKPFFANFGASFGTFTAPAFRAIGQMKKYPTGANWTWNGIALSLVAPRTDNAWIVATSAGMRIVLAKTTPAAGDYSPVNFTATSSADNTLDYHGSFDNIVTKSVTVEGTPRTVVSSADMAASYIDHVIGAGNTTTMSAHLQADTNVSNDITGFRIGLGFASPAMTGSTQLAVTCLVPYAEYSDNNSLTASGQASQISLTSASLTVVGAGRFDGNFQFDLEPSKYTWERFDINITQGGSTRLRIFWDERTGTPQLLDVDGSGLDSGFRRWKSIPPTAAGGTWTLTKKNGMGYTAVWTITVSGSGAGRTISGSVVKNAPGNSGTFNFTTVEYLDKFAVAAIPTTAIFFGGYTNLDPSVPLDNVTGSITAVFINPQAADPFIVGQFETYDVAKDNFPRVLVIFTGTVKPTNAGVITGQVMTENRFVAKNTTGLPQAGYDFVVADVTTYYAGGTETIAGTSTWYYRMPDAVGYGNRGTEFSEAALSLVNAVGVTFTLELVNSGTLTGAVANSVGTNLGTLDLTGSVPILRWTDGSFESLP
jgi:hypothetical protein